MSNDLEEFLKRAAQRRQANQAKEATQKTAAKQKPASQYSDARSERTIRIEPEDDEILMAEIIPDDVSRMAPQRKNSDRSGSSQRSASSRSNSSQRNSGESPADVQRRPPPRRATERPRRAESRSAKAIQNPIQTVNPVGEIAPMATGKADRTGSQDDFYAVRNDANMGELNVADLIAALQSPAGFRQAILMKEILDRPTHRW